MIYMEIEKLITIKYKKNKLYDIYIGSLSHGQNYVNFNKKETKELIEDLLNEIEALNEI